MKMKDCFSCYFIGVGGLCGNSVAAESHLKNPNFDYYLLFHWINCSDPSPTEVNVDPHTEFNAPATYFKRKHFN